MSYLSLTDIAKQKAKINVLGRPLGSGYPALLTARIRPGAIAPNGALWYRDRIVFRIDETLWQAAKFTAGDCVEVLYDPKTRIGKIKKAKHGYTLSPQGYHTSCDLKLLIPYFPETEFPHFFDQTGMDEVKAKKGEIKFRVPKVASKK